MATFTVNIFPNDKMDIHRIARPTRSNPSAIDRYVMLETGNAVTGYQSQNESAVMTMMMTPQSKRNEPLSALMDDDLSALFSIAKIISDTGKRMKTIWRIVLRV